jgi:uncharacterized protein (TIGR02271 family)
MSKSRTGEEMTDENDKILNSEQRMIPVIEEQLHISKELLEVGKVIISKKIIEEQVDTEMKVFHDDVTVETKVIGEYIEGKLPEIRTQGETTIIPVIKEVIVKRLILVEEIHITKRQKETLVPIHEVLRKEEITISRNDSLSTTE